MLRVHKIVALLIAAISFSKEDAFAHRRDYDGFRAMHARRAYLPSHPWDGRRAVAVPMGPGFGPVPLHARRAFAVPMRTGFGPVPLYARRVSGPLLMRMGVMPGRVCSGPAMRLSVVPASRFLCRVYGSPMVMRRAYSPGFWRW